MSELLREWVERHSELQFGEYGQIQQNGSDMGRIRGDRITLGPEDGGVRGEIVELDGDWLIVEGSQACYVGEGEEHHYEHATKLHDGMVEWTGRFAVQPTRGMRPEIDGPLPEDD